MKRKLILISALILPFVMAAQTKELDYTYLEPEFETGARFDANLQIDLIPKSLVLTLQEEMRVNENFSHLQRSYTSADLEYKVLPWLKAGVSYSFILNNKTQWDIRHRGTFYLSEGLRAGRWKFSLKETLQATCRTDSVNLYQSPKTELSLKTRLKVAYDVPGSHFEPFVSAETRFLLNGVRPGKFVYYEDAGRWSNPNPEYTDVYFNRLRLKLGTEYKVTKRNVLDFYLIADLKYDLDIDFSSKGNQKTDDTSDTAFADYLFVKNSYFVGIGISYTFKL